MLGRGSNPTMGTLLAIVANKENNDYETIGKWNTTPACEGSKSAPASSDEHGKEEAETSEDKVNEEEPEETNPDQINDNGGRVVEDGDRTDHKATDTDGDATLEVPEAGIADEDGDNPGTDVQSSIQMQHPPLDYSNAVIREDEDEEDDDDKGDDREKDEDFGDDDDEDDDDEEDEAKEDEEEDAKVTSSTTSTMGTGMGGAPTSNASLTSSTEPTGSLEGNMSEGASGVTSLTPQALPRKGPTPVTVQVENAFAVQVGNGNVLTYGAPASSADACPSGSESANVAVYINNCDVVQVGNHNQMTITEKVTPQENGFVKVCCDLGIDAKTADGIIKKLSQKDVLEQFAKKMAESFNLTCKIRAARRGCILLELEVPTEEDRLQLLRMARDGTFQQVLLETFLPEFAGEGRAVNMNLAIGVRNPSQGMVEELQDAVASSGHEKVEVIEIPDSVSPGPAAAVTNGTSAPEQQEPRSDQPMDKSQKQPEDEMGVVKDSPDQSLRDVPDEDNPGVDRNIPASNTDDVSQLTSLLRLLSEPGEDVGDDGPHFETADQAPDPDDQRLEPDDQPLTPEDQPLAQVDQPFEADDQHLEQVDQPLEGDDQHLAPDDQRLQTDARRIEPDGHTCDSSFGYASITQEEPTFAVSPGSAAHSEEPSEFTTSKVFESSRSKDRGDDETTRILSRLAITLDSREWKQVAGALRVQQPDKDLSADDTQLRMRILRAWQEGPFYREQFDKLLLALEACGRDDFAVVLLQSAPYTSSHGPQASAREVTHSEVSSTSFVAPVFKQPRKPKKTPVLDPRTPLRKMPYSLMKKVAMELDPPGQLVNWKDLAAKAGYSMQEIGVFEMQYLKLGGSPTTALLQAWGSKNATVQDLETALRRIGLLNVADMLSQGKSDDEDV